MSLFRPGPVPAGVIVENPVWPSFAPTEEPELNEQEWTSLAPPSSEKAADTAWSQDLRYENREAPDLINDAYVQAAQILQEAAAEAEAALREARREGLEAGRKEGFASGHQEGLQAGRQEAMEAGHQEGYECGYQEGLAAGQEELDRLKQSAQEELDKARALYAQAQEEARSLVEQARKQRNQLLDSIPEAVVDLVTLGAVRIVQEHLAVKPSAIIGMVVAGIRRLKDADCTVRLHPEDLALVQEHRGVLDPELGAGTMHLQRDASLDRGSYLITSSQGDVDGRIDRQAELLEAALQASLGVEAP